MYSQPSMSRRRPHGKPMGRYGLARSAVPVCNITLRDVHDAYVRAVCRCSDDPEMAEDALNGENAKLNSYMIADKQTDPIAVGAALLEEIEKLMGIYPNLMGVELPAPPQRRASDRITDPDQLIPKDPEDALVKNQYNSWEERERLQAKARRIGVYMPDKPSLFQRIVGWFG
jgi:hypothetical protein